MVRIDPLLTRTEKIELCNKLEEKASKNLDDLQFKIDLITQYKTKITSLRPE